MVSVNHGRPCMSAMRIEALFCQNGLGFFISNTSIVAERRGFQLLLGYADAANDLKRPPIFLLDQPTFDQRVSVKRRTSVSVVAIHQEYVRLPVGESWALAEDNRLSALTSIEASDTSRITLPGRQPRSSHLDIDMDSENLKGMLVEQDPVS